MRSAGCGQLASANASRAGFARAPPPSPQLARTPGNIGSLRSIWFRNAAEAALQDLAPALEENPGKSHRAAGAYGAHSARLQHRWTRRPAAVRQQLKGPARVTPFTRPSLPTPLARPCQGTVKVATLAGGKTLTCWLSLRSTSLHSAAADETAPPARCSAALCFASGNQQDSEKQDRRESSQLFPAAPVTK